MLEQGRIQVVYIAGHGRSGSTLLAQALGQVPGAMAVGETKHVARARALEGDVNSRCGCGESFAHCPVWRQVSAGLSQPGDVFTHHLAGRLRDVDRLRRIPRTLWSISADPPRNDPALAELQARYRELYRGLLSVTGARSIVESSKDPGLLAVLCGAPEFKVEVVHLIRDPRATAFSWSRERTRPDTASSVKQVQFRPMAASIRWMEANCGVEIVKHWAESYHRVRYEDLVRDPRGVLDRLFRELQWATAENPFVSERNVLQLSRRTHIIWSSPHKFSDGSIQVRMDDEWRTGLSKWKQAAVILLTAPLFLRYGYPSPSRP